MKVVHHCLKISHPLSGIDNGCLRNDKRNARYKNLVAVLDENSDRGSAFERFLQNFIRKNSFKQNDEK
ncbi:MAG: hypothetical protein RIS64_2934 [Bacteroidota bacterium]|jgi:uncharacterized FlgJ-related protein